MPDLVELNFDGIVGPTHNYSGLSAGNLACVSHSGKVSNPRAAALEGLAKMQQLASLGIPQAVFPPQHRPHIAALRTRFTGGTDADVIERAYREDPALLARCSSASSMWAANSATVIPSTDTADGRLHLVPANLSAMFHRSIEAAGTTRILRAIFGDREHFCVHDPLPDGAEFADEGAANHSRLQTSLGSAHLFSFGRSQHEGERRPQLHPARQSRTASEAVVERCGVSAESALYWQQDPDGIDAGAFHTDVLAVGNLNFMFCHELAWASSQQRIAELRARLGPELQIRVVTQSELSASDAVKHYPFNSQLVSLPDRSMALIAPAECASKDSVRELFVRVLSEANPLSAVHYVDVHSSMNNGGGPACLRLRVLLTAAARAVLGGRLLFTNTLYQSLQDWVRKHYRDRLDIADLADPQLLIEGQTALDELSQLLALGSIYDFQMS